MGILPTSWRVFKTAMALAMGLGGAAQAQTLAPHEAPRAWVVYAELVTKTVSAWLSEESQGAVRLRKSLLEGEPRATGLAALQLKLWIEPQGLVSKVGVTSPNALAMDADLQALIAGRRLPPPPQGLLQPLRLAIDIEPHEANEEGAGQENAGKPEEGA